MCALGLTALSPCAISRYASPPLRAIDGRYDVNSNANRCYLYPRIPAAVQDSARVQCKDTKLSRRGRGRSKTPISVTLLIGGKRPGSLAPKGVRSIEWHRRTLLPTRHLDTLIR